MDASTPSTSGISDALLAFGVVPERVEATPGNTTSLWRIDANGSSYVLRLHDRDAAAKVLTRHDLLDFLATRFRRAPQVVRTRNEHEFVDGSEGLYELLTYVPGAVGTAETFDWDDDALLESAAGLLADLHLGLRDYTPQQTAEWWTPQPIPSESIVEIHLRRDKSEEAKAILDSLLLMYQYLASPSASGSPRHVIHNDFAWYNVVQNNHAATGVIDFDAAHVNSELHDLAYALYAFTPIRDSIGPTPRAVDRTAQRVALFLRSYERRLGEKFVAPVEALFDTAAKRVALLEADLIAGWLKQEERSTRLVSHAVGYSEWLRWYERSRSQLVSAGDEVR